MAFLQEIKQKLMVKNYSKIDLNSSQTFWKGLSMWILLFMGYMFFCSNWLIMSKLEGSNDKGWSQVFGIGNKGESVKELVNCAVTFARGLAAIPAAFLVSKLTHKYSVIISLFLATTAFWLILSPNFYVFILGRMIMGFGGTLLIIYIQPVIVNWFNDRNKGKLSMLNGLAYTCGALLINLVFLSKNAGDYLVANWKPVALIFGALTFIPFFGYIFLGINFEAESSSNCDISLKNCKPNTYKEIIQERETWLWIFFYSLLIVISVFVSTFVPKIIKKTAPSIFQATNTIGLSWSSLYTCLFYLGSVCGMVLGLLNRQKMQRKPIVQSCCFLTLIFWLIIFAGYLLGMSDDFFGSSVNTIATVIIFFSIFGLAFFGMGLQSVLLYIPHEYKGNTSKRLTIFYAYIWGIGYILYSVYHILGAAVLDNIEFLAMFYVTIFVVLYYVLALLIREPNPTYPVFSLFKWKLEDKSNEFSAEEKLISDKEIIKPQETERI